MVITQNEKPIARLVIELDAQHPPRVPGSAKGMIAFMSDDFDAPLEDFKDGWPFMAITKTRKHEKPPLKVR